MCCHVTDRKAAEHVKQLLATPNNPEMLRQAITQDELQGVNRIHGKKNAALTGVLADTGPPPPLPAKVTTDKPVTGSLERKKIKVTSTQPQPTKMKNGGLDESFEEGEDRFESCIDISLNSAPKGSSDGLHKHQEGGRGNLPGDLLLDLTKSNSVSSEPTKSVDKSIIIESVKQFGNSKSVPNSPGGLIDSICCSSLGKSRKAPKLVDCARSHATAREDHNSDSSSPVCVSCESPVSAVDIMSATNGSFTYSPPAVRISKSEDKLQCSDDGDMCSVNTDLEDDVTSSLNTLLDTREEDEAASLSSPVSTSNNVWLFSTLSCTMSSAKLTTTCAATTSSMVTTGCHQTPVTVVSLKDQRSVQCSNSRVHSPLGSTHSSHDSDSPLLHSPSPPHSPVSPSSSVPFSSSGIYDKIHCTRDTNQSGNVCSNSSSVTSSPDTDIPDELEWDETTPYCVPTSVHSVTCSSSSKQLPASLTNGHNNRRSSSCRSSPRHASINSSNNTQHHLNLVNFDTSSSSSSSHVLHEKVKRKKDENRIVIKVAGPDKSSSSSTLGKSGDSIKSSDIKRNDSSSSIDRSTRNRRLRNALSGEERCMSNGSQDRGPTAIITSSCGVGVIPGVDNDLTPTNTPSQTPPISPSLSLQHPKAEAQYCSMPRQLSTPSRSSPPPPQVSPQTPGSGTLSPETLAYQQLWESEDEFTSSCISEDDVSRSLGGGSVGSKGSVSHSHSHSQHSSSSQSGGTVGGGVSVVGAEGDVGSLKGTTSPTLSEDESDIESLHSFHYSPKAVDIPSAVRLAKRLYHLDGFKKTDVSRHLSKK